MNQAALLMRKRISIAVFVLVCVALVRHFVGGSPLPPMFESRPTLESALTASRTDGRTVIAFYTADWCTPCSRLKSGALQDTRIIAAFADVHAALIDCTATHPASDPYDVDAYPTLVAIRDGKEISRVSGALQAENLLAWLQTVINPS